MSDSLKRVGLRALGVLAMGIAGMSATGRPAVAEAAWACTKVYCDDQCSLMGCLGVASCDVSGSCAWSALNQCWQVTCDPMQ